MHYNKAVRVLANQAKRDDDEIIQAAKAILTVGDAEEHHAVMARLALREIRTRMWHADPAVQSTDPSVDGLLIERPRTARAAVSLYKRNLIDISAVIAASLFVLCVGLTSNVFSDPLQVQAEILEIDELLLFAAVMLLGSVWAGSRLIQTRRMSAA